MDDLAALPEADQERMADLMRVLGKAAPMPEAQVPADAMIREFIGNGQFAY